MRARSLPLLFSLGLQLCPRRCLFGCARCDPLPFSASRTLASGPRASTATLARATSATTTSCPTLRWRKTTRWVSSVCQKGGPKDLRKKTLSQGTLENNHHSRSIFKALCFIFLCIVLYSSIFLLRLTYGRSAECATSSSKRCSSRAGRRPKRRPTNEVCVVRGAKAHRALRRMRTIV